MTITLTLFWTALISLLSVVGAYYVRRFNRADAIIALYVTLVLVANITASKVVTFNFGFAELYAPAAVLIFAVTFLMTDIVNERFGRGEAQRMILIAIVSQCTLVLSLILILKAKGAPFFENQFAFESVFGMVPRIVIASLIAFFVSENIDAYIFHWFRRMTDGKHLWMRNVFSSFPAMFFDSTIFIGIAFYGVLPVLPLIIGQTFIKWLVAVVDIPFMYLSRRVMGKFN